ncbi:1-phosphofructokinase family hexose kinase [Microbacterium sp. NPDC058342]|uniref:1-phosphofructokinase family hexose kinase n=1 Tax=Microbacterium sp. NPDC058342 TaxID=3346454 RepID=UPI003661484C
MDATVHDRDLDDEQLELTALTFTPAPSIDRTYSLSTLQPGEVNRAGFSRTALGGKGVNVAGSLVAGRKRAIAVLPLDPALVPASVPDHLEILDVAGVGRTNVILVEDGGATTNVNDRAAPMATDDWLGLHHRVLATARRERARWVVLGGALPDVDGRPAPLERLAAETQLSGIRVALDTAGVELRRLLAAGMRPDLVKPNASELSEATGHAVPDLDGAVAAAQVLRDMGASAVLASLGDRGAIYLDDRHSLICAAPRVPVLDTTGAGDALLAGFLSRIETGGSLDIHDALCTGVSWGALTVQSTSPVASALPSSHGLSARELPAAVPLG